MSVERSYQWLHTAIEADDGPFRRGLDALSVYLRAGDDAPLFACVTREAEAREQARWQICISVSAAVVRERIERASALLDAARATATEWYPEIESVAEPLTRARERANAASAEIVVSRAAWEELEAELARHDELARLGAPIVIIVEAAKTSAELAASLFVADLRPIPEVRLEGSLDYDGDELLEAPDLWDALAWLTNLSFRPYARIEQGVGARVEEWPAHRELVRTHTVAWPTDQGFWEAHEQHTRSSRRIMDVYPEPQLFRPPGLSFERSVLPDWQSVHRVVRRAYPDHARIGVGENGGPLTIASGVELVRHAALAREIASTLPPDAADALHGFASRCEEIGRREGTLISWVLLDAPEP